MDMIGKVRGMKWRDQLSDGEICRRTGLARNTVKKWLRAPGNITPKYERKKADGKLTPFVAVLEQALRTDAHRAKNARRSEKALFAQIQAQGYRGGYSAVTDFIRAWRVESAKDPARAFVPLSFELGEAFQFDWSEEGLLVGGVFYKLQVAHLKLCASRAFWLVAYPGQGHEMLFDAHTRAFQALGGVARRGIYDNMKTAVDKVKMQGPYFAVKVLMGDLGTFDGLRTSVVGEVLRTDGTPIEGLFAAGNDRASVMGGNYPGAGITHGPNMTFGYITANHIADQAAGHRRDTRAAELKVVPA
ncbi:MAG: IS21 family transposase [Burkholderiales bacterium]|nr:IS21 family transposase [Burkholderiales bacterium]